MSKLSEALEVARCLPPIEKPGTRWRQDCSFGDPATFDEIRDAWGEVRMPSDIMEFWGICSFAKFFVETSSLWGIELMSPAESRHRTEEEFDRIPDELEVGDIVIGRFHGHADVLIRKGGPGPGLVLAPDLLVDDYCDWWVLGETVGDFVEKYVAARGEFWWEGKPFEQPLVRTWPRSLGATLDDG